MEDQLRGKGSILYFSVSQSIEYTSHEMSSFLFQSIQQLDAIISSPFSSTNLTLPSLSSSLPHILSSNLLQQSPFLAPCYLFSLSLSLSASVNILHSFHIIDFNTNSFHSIHLNRYFMRSPPISNIYDLLIRRFSDRILILLKSEWLN